VSCRSYLNIVMKRKALNISLQLHSKQNTDQGTKEWLSVVSRMFLSLSHPCVCVCVCVCVFLLANDKIL
jgi:hypothetical protein